MHMLEQLTKFITSLEVSGANGAEVRMDDVIETVTGRSPQKFGAWMKENKAAWQKIVSEPLRAQLCLLLSKASSLKP